MTAEKKVHWLCRLGWHKWRRLGYGPLMITEDMQCRRCGPHGISL